MKLSKSMRYVAFIILGLSGTVVLILVSELIGFSHMNFVAFASPSYAVWVYPIYLLISFLIFRKVFNLPKKVRYYVTLVFIIFLVWYFFSAEGGMFSNPIPFGINAI